MLKCQSELLYCAKPLLWLFRQGAQKHRLVHASVKAGYVNVLATDAATARYLLEQDHE